MNVMASLFFLCGTHSVSNMKRLPAPPLLSLKLNHLVQHSKEHYRKVVLSSFYFKGQQLSNDIIFRKTTSSSFTACVNIIVKFK